MSVPDDKGAQRLRDLPDDIEVVVWDGLTDRPDAADRIAYFVGAYGSTPPPARDVFASLDSLRVIQVTSAGYEPWLPVVPDGVVLCNGRGIHTKATAEMALAGLLAVVRDLPEFGAAQQRHEWAQRSTDTLEGKRVLVIGGSGDIGGHIAAAVEVFGASTTSVAHRARAGVHAMDDLPGLLPDHDVIVVAIPQTPDTAGLVDADLLGRMPDGAVLVNIARGGIVDTDALLAELNARRLRAYLDVTDPEPLPADHPLWDAPNLVITPHSGGGTRGWDRRAYALVADQIMRLRDGRELRNRVTDGS